MSPAVHSVCLSAGVWREGGGRRGEERRLGRAGILNVWHASAVGLLTTNFRDNGVLFSLYSDCRRQVASVFFM